MKILDINTKNFYKKLDFLLLKRKNKIQSKSVSVTNIIKDVRKNGDKALIKYEKKFNKNSIIKPSQSKIKNSIKSLNPKVKKALDKSLKFFEEEEEYEKCAVLKKYLDFLNFSS